MIRASSEAIEVAVVGFAALSGLTTPIPLHRATASMKPFLGNSEPIFIFRCPEIHFGRLRKITNCSFTLPDAESFTCALPIRASWQAPPSTRWHPGVPGIHGAGGISLRSRCALSAELRDIRDRGTPPDPAARTP